MDLHQTGVKVIAVCPGLTHTDFHEKLGMDPARQINRGLIQWMSPEKIVMESLRDLKKGRVVSIPGLHTKILACVFQLIPDKLSYQMLYQFSRKQLSR